MNVLIVSAHPDPASLTNALRDVAADQLTSEGHAVRSLDLYAQGWKSAVDRADFPGLAEGQRLLVSSASAEAFASGTLTPDVRASQDALLWADALILAFPLWWFGMPAIMKGWIDRVWAFGFAYGVGEHSERRWGDRYGEGTLAGKRAMLIVAVGGWAEHYGPRGINGPINDLLFPIQHGILFYPGYAVVPPFVAYRADRFDESRFAAAETALRKHVRGMFTVAPIAFRRQNGGEYAIPTMELAPTLAPGRTGFDVHIDHGVTHGSAA